MKNSDNWLRAIPLKFLDISPVVSLGQEMKENLVFETRTDRSLINFLLNQILKKNSNCIYISTLSLPWTYVLCQWQHNHLTSVNLTVGFVVEVIWVVLQLPNHFH